MAKAFPNTGVTTGLAADRTAMTGMVTGQAFVETDTKRFWVYDGTDWIDYTSVPIVTTTQRGRITPTTGTEIYNTTTGAFEYYNGSSWQISRPYAMTAGSVYGGATTQVDTVTYPSGRFSQTPILHLMTPANNQLPTTSAQSSTSFTWDNNPNNVNLTMHWIAIQMKSGAAGE